MVLLCAVLGDFSQRSWKIAFARISVSQQVIFCSLEGIRLLGRLILSFVGVGGIFSGKIFRRTNKIAQVA